MRGHRDLLCDAEKQQSGTQATVSGSFPLHPNGAGNDSDQLKPEPSIIQSGWEFLFFPSFRPNGRPNGRSGETCIFDILDAWAKVYGCWETLSFLKSTHFCQNKAIFSATFAVMGFLYTWGFPDYTPIICLWGVCLRALHACNVLHAFNWVTTPLEDWVQLPK